MVNPLVQMHPEQHIRVDLSVSPPDVPISTALLALHNPSKLFGNFLNDGVLCVADIDDYVFGLELLGEFGDGDNFGRVVGAELLGNIGWVVVVVGLAG